MARRFFKKFEPGTKVTLDNGAKVEFGTTDRIVGYFSTDNEYVIRQFDQFISEQRYALTEIDEAEYNAYAEKKRNLAPLPTPWREEIGASGINRQSVIAQMSVLSGAAAAGEKTTVTASTPLAVAAPPVDQPEVKLNVGRRRKK